MKRRVSAFHAVIVMAGVLLLAMILSGLPRVVAAARPEAGTHGTFTAQTRSCTDHAGHTSCNWQGRFESDDGRTTRADVTLYGSGGDLKVGERTVGRDIGSGNYVYLMRSSREWIFSSLLALVALLLIAHGARHLIVRTPREAPASSRV